MRHRALTALLDSPGGFFIWTNLCIGAWLLLPMDTLATSPVLGAFLRIGPTEWEWALIFLFVGLLKWALETLGTRGALETAAIMGAIWAGYLAAVYAQANPLGLAVPLYGAIAIWMLVLLYRRIRGSVT